MNRSFGRAVAEKARYHVEKMRASPQYIVLFHHFRGFLEAAARAGVDAAPLKGAHLLTSVYPEGADRGPLSDVDFLVRSEQWDRAIAVAHGLGWRRRPSSRDEARTHEIGFRVALEGGREILLEMHRYLFDPRRFAVDHGAIWSRSYPGSFDGAPCHRLAPEDHFAHLAFHAVLHRMGFLDQTLCDLDRLLVGGPFDRDALVARAREWHVKRAVWFALARLCESRPALELERHRDALAPGAPIRAAARRLVDLSAALGLAERHYTLAAAIVWPVLFDDGASLARAIANHPQVTSALGRRIPALS
jgi:hypothetical protein